MQPVSTDINQLAGHGVGPGLERLAHGLVAAAEWLVTQDPMLLGSDNQPIEIQPNPDPQISLPIHQMMLAVHGIHLLELAHVDQENIEQRTE